MILKRQHGMLPIQFIVTFLGITELRTVEKLLVKCFQGMKCCISLKLHILSSHLDSFPQNLGEVSDEHSGRFHQDISIMEKWFVGRWKCGMLAEYCWSIVRETPESGYKRKRSRKTF